MLCLIILNHPRAGRCPVAVVGSAVGALPIVDVAGALEVAGLDVVVVAAVLVAAPGRHCE